MTRRGFGGMHAGQRVRMTNRLISGITAGAAGTTALNAATYVDMAVRARGSSSTPEQVVAELARRAGQGIPGNDQERANRLQGLGALAGIATGLAVGIAAGQLRGIVTRLGPVLGPVLLGGAAMAATDLTMARLGVTDLASWDASSWLSDAIPHLAYGVTAYAALASG